MTMPQQLQDSRKVDLEFAKACQAGHGMLNATLVPGFERASIDRGAIVVIDEGLTVGQTDAMASALQKTGHRIR